MAVPASYPGPVGGRPVVPTGGMLRPLGLAEVSITGGFWGRRQRLSGTALDHSRIWTDKVGWTGNFVEPTTAARRPGSVAVERGPIALCVESPRGTDPDLDAVRVHSDILPHDGDGDDVVVVADIEEPVPSGWPYDGVVPRESRTTTTLRLVPYHRWGRRGPATMRVWLPTA